MPAQPVVEIDVRHSSPYNWRAWSQADPLNGHSTSGRDSVVASRSHTPVFVSANKVASTSTSSVNQLPGYKAKPVKADHVPRPAHAKKHAGDNDVVRPPAHEPRLRSVFVDGPRSSPWLPSHRVPRNTEAVTCQWVLSDEGFGDIQRCEQVFTTTESLAKHVHFVHCELARSSNLLGAGQTQLLPCAWGACRFKRYSPTRLKEHVLEHLRPLAFRCPFETCRMSANSLIGSVDDLEGHVQTYHVHGEPLRPLGIPRSVKAVFSQPPPALPRTMPRWMINNPPIGLRPDYRQRLPVMQSPDLSRPGEIQPWDQVWLDLDQHEPPAIPISPSLLASLPYKAEPPTIRITTVPEARPLERFPRTTPEQVNVDAPQPDRVTAFIDLTNDDVDVLPPAPRPRYQPSGDPLAHSAAEAWQQDRQKRIPAESASSDNDDSDMEDGERDSSVGRDAESDMHDEQSVTARRAQKRVKLEDEDM